MQDGDRLDVKLMIFQVNKGVTSKGSPYLSMQLQDKSGMMDAKYWNVKESEISKYQAGMICRFRADVLSHNKQLQIRIAAMEEIDRSQENVEDYVRSSSIGKAELEYKIGNIVDSIENDSYKRLVKACLLEDGDAFYTYPAASKNHHNYVGGLASHVLSMCELGAFVCKQYPLLNRDLLISGIILHDLGKVVELSGPMVVEYTIEGKLLGHISIMQAKLYEIAQRLHIESEELTLLRHMILSHHGKLEYGSPVLPLIPEAEILSYIDNMDARMNTLEMVFSNVQSGNFSPRIFALDNRSFYKAKDK